jgi:Holin of 3TMs, for gene-transfer release
MGLFDGLLKDGVSTLGGTIGGMAKDIRTAITGKEAVTADEREKILAATQEMEKLALQADNAINLAQIDLDKTEAQSPSFFRAGWRPAVGWVCVLGLTYQFLIRPIVPWVTSAFFPHATLPAMASLELGTLMTLLFGMLGLGAARTVEKLNGVN